MQQQFTLTGFSLSGPGSLVTAAAAADWLSAVTAFSERFRDHQFVAAFSGYHTAAVTWADLPTEKRAASAPARGPAEVYTWVGANPISQIADCFHVEAPDHISAALAGLLHRGTDLRFCCVLRGRHLPIGSWSCYRELSQPVEMLSTWSR